MSGWFALDTVALTWNHFIGVKSLCLQESTKVVIEKDIAKAKLGTIRF